jgi:aminoglycoside phosphotransferase (APT) family kinase protein
MADPTPGAVLDTTDPARLAAAVAAEGWPLDLDGAELDDSGWENVVLATRDDWIVRFPRDEALPFQQELAALNRLRGRLPVAIPEPRYVGRKVRMMAYRKLVGATFDESVYRAAEPAQRTLVARSLAEFLAAVHAVPPAADTPVIRHADTHRRIVERLDRVPASRRKEIAELADRFARTWVEPGAVPGPAVLLHNDFHLDNMVFDGPAGRLAAVWDFSCVAVGSPTFDLRYFDRGPRDLMARLAAEYTACTGREIDLAAAALARRIEDIDDAITTGRMEILERL